MASDASISNLTHQVLRLTDVTHQLVGVLQAAELRARQQDKARQAITDAFAFVEHPNAVLDWKKAVEDNHTMLGFTDWLEKEAQS